jgi:hypothetical protein
MVGFPDAEGSDQGQSVRYQVLDQDLNILGEQNGTLVSQTGEPQSVNKFNLVYANDNIYFAYSEQGGGDNPFDIFIQKFDEAGNAVFSSPISIVSDSMQDKNVRSIIEIPGIGVMIVYDAESWMGRSVNFIGIDYDGNILNGWEGGLSICENSEDQQFEGVVRTSNGIYIIWKDYRGDGNDIYGQMVAFDGNLVGDPDGIPIAVENNDQGNPSMSYSEHSDEIFV